MTKHNGEIKVQITATIDKTTDDWLRTTVGEFGSKAGLISKILKQAHEKDTQDRADNEVTHKDKEGD